MPFKSPKVNKIRAWFCFHLLRAAMWLTDGVELRCVGKSFVTCEGRNHRTKALHNAPIEIEMSPGDVFLYIGSWQDGH